MAPCFDARIAFSAGDDGEISIGFEVRKLVETTLLGLNIGYGF